jgi:hypothetical protein
MAKTSNQSGFWHGRWGALVIGVLALAASYLLASRAIETGSLQQYALMFVLFGFAIWFLVKGIKAE